jgi:5-methyltetrahydrofolate--homocysteine methyltransferase
MWNRIVVLDGAMGSLLWNPPSDSVENIHRQYLNAGADIIKTNTFTTNRGSQNYETNVAAAKTARRIADEFQPSRVVAGSIGPGGKSVSDYAEQVRGLSDGGVNLLLVETMTSISVSRMVLEACNYVLPVMLSVTISKDGKLLSDETLEEFCKAVSSYPLVSMGINCSYGARHMKPYIQEFAQIADLPVSCHPSAGLPDSDGSYPESPEEWALAMLEFAERGWVDIVGGCCGTTPAHIEALARSVREIPRATIDLL